MSYLSRTATAHSYPHPHLQEKYVPPQEARSSPEQASGIQQPTAHSRSIGPLRHLALAGLAAAVTDDVLVEACALSSAGGGLREIDLSGCGESLPTHRLVCLHFIHSHASYTCLGIDGWTD